MTAEQAETLARHLEELVDAHGMPAVINRLVDVCQDKADHLRANWQDYATAKRWDDAGDLLLHIIHSVRELL